MMTNWPTFWFQKTWVKRERNFQLTMVRGKHSEMTRSIISKHWDVSRCDEWRMNKQLVNREFCCDWNKACLKIAFFFFNVIRTDGFRSNQKSLRKWKDSCQNAVRSNRMKSQKLSEYNRKSSEYYQKNQKKTQNETRNDQKLARRTRNS